MTFGKRSQFSLTETVASVTHIINPINSHNTTANLSQKRGGKGEGEKYKKVLNIFLKPSFPFIKQIALIPGIVIKAQRVWIRIQIPLVPGKLALKVRVSLCFNPSLSETEMRIPHNHEQNLMRQHTPGSYKSARHVAHVSSYWHCWYYSTHAHHAQRTLGDLRVANRPSTALNTPGLFSKTNYHAAQMQAWANLHVMFHLKKLRTEICQRLKRIKPLLPRLSSILEPIW